MKRKRMNTLQQQGFATIKYVLKNRLKKMIVLFLSTAALNGYANVELKGKTADETTGTIQIYQSLPFLTDVKRDYIFTSAKESDNFDINLKVDKPQFFAFFFSKTYITQYVFISPNDKINFIIEKDKIVFSGENSGAYNFLTDLKQVADDRNKPFYKKDKSVEDYKIAVKAWFDRKQNFLNNYKKDHNLTPAAFNFFEQNIKYQYYFDLLAPISVSFKNKYVLAGLNLDVRFNQDNLLHSDGYSSALIRKYLYTEIEHPYNHFIEVYDNANKKLKGKTRDYFMANMLGLFVQNSPDANKKDLEEKISLEKKSTKDSVIFKYLTDQWFKLEVLGKELPNSVLDETKLLSYQGKELNLRTFLNNNLNKAIYIDFWASWCSPCRIDIANSENAKNLLEKNNVVYVYLSTDKDQKAWQKAVVEDKIEDNQYLLPGSFKNTISKYFQVNYIPRYIFLDENHKVKTINAPRPLEKNLKALRGMISTAKIVTY